jgi:signal peptidase I
MNFLQRRRWRKQAREVLTHAAVARAIREDIAAPDDLAALDEAGAAVREGMADRTVEDLPNRVESLAAAAETVRPRAGHVAENIEVIIVALAVAMGIRTFFLQPFRIPTGSMQPTLYGVQIEDVQYATATGSDAGGIDGGGLPVRPLMDRFPMNLTGWAVYGRGYVEVKAKVSGTVADMRVPIPGEDAYFILVGGVRHQVRDKMPLRVQPGQFVRRGEVLASGRVTIGDHVLVNKVRYNFQRPRRGDITVFETHDIPYPGLQGAFYIKRLVGLPGERIEIRPPHLIADGAVVTEPEAFRRMVEDTAHYAGYIRASPSWPRPKLMMEGDAIALARDEYLPLGDNTRASLDGRYFGGVRRAALVGPASCVYWPFSERWGWTR